MASVVVGIMRRVHAPYLTGSLRSCKFDPVKFVAPTGEFLLPKSKSDAGCIGGVKSKTKKHLIYSALSLNDPKQTLVKLSIIVGFHHKSDLGRISLIEKNRPLLIATRKAYMNCKNYFLLLILSLFMTACASNQWEHSEVEEVFVTDIKSSGLKIFNYSLTNTTAQASGNGKRGGSGKGSGKYSGRGGKGGGKSNGHGGMSSGKSAYESNMKPYFNEMLESKLKRSGYCREGYIELNSYFGRGQLKTRGECEESATEEDRIKFVNKEST